MFGAEGRGKMLELGEQTALDVQRDFVRFVEE
jgi:hypothetical protein